MPIFRTLSTFVALIAISSSQAQSTVPTLIQPLPPVSLVAGGLSVAVDLRNYFNVPSVTGQVLQFDVLGNKFNVELLANDAPKTVANFLNYVTRGAYTNSIVHRSVAGFVIQGGGFTYGDGQLTPVPTDPPVQNEFKLSNIRGTLAMAKSPGGPDTATSQWFVNLADNSGGNPALDTANGGYTVFARVLGTGMSVPDAVAALHTYDQSSTLGADFTAIPQLGPALTGSNLILIRSIAAVPVYPTIGRTTSLMTLAGSIAAGDASTVTAVIYGSTLSITPIVSGNVTISISATDTNSNTVSSATLVTVAAAPVFGTQPVGQTVAAGDSVALSAVATAGTAPTYQWQLNGSNLSGATGSSISLSNVQPANAGLYAAVATSGTATTSVPAIVGVRGSTEVIGAGTVLATHIQHPNGKFYDQILPTGAAEAVTTGADTVRTSFIDDNNDIVQVEFAGAGTLSLVLDNPSGPATPVNYSQNQAYMKGHAGIVIVGADETTNVSIFTVGRATAFDPTGNYNILLAPSATNVPANNGSSLFVGHETTAYDGVADVAFVAISSTNGRFGGLRAANARFSASKGWTGVYAPGVQFAGPIFVGDIIASSFATPTLIVGSCADARVTGGPMLQSNRQPVKVKGLTQLKFTAGSNSGGTALPGYFNQAILLQDGVNVTDQTVVY